MGSDPRKRQKKLEKKAPKRKDKKHQLVREKNAGLSDRLTAAAKFPVLDCWITETFYDQGMGWVVLSREIPNGTVAVATFLVDRYCLGVKDLHAEVIGRATYDEKYDRKMRTEMRPRQVSPADARKLLDEAVAYARELGFSPPADYPKVLPIFGSTDPAQSTAQYEFGKDGKPYFIAGPYDTPQRCRQILAILSKNRSPDQYHFTMPIMPTSRIGAVPEDFGMDAEEFDEDFDEDEE